MLLITTLPGPPFCVNTVVGPCLMVYIGAGYPPALHVRVTVVPCTTALPGVPIVKLVTAGRSKKRHFIKRNLYTPINVKVKSGEN